MKDFDHYFRLHHKDSVPDSGTRLIEKVFQDTLNIKAMHTESPDRWNSANWIFQGATIEWESTHTPYFL